MKINLNDNVTVRLTEKGRIIWNACHPYQKVEGDYLTAQFHNIIRTLGAHIGHGLVDHDWGVMYLDIVITKVYEK